MKKLNEEWLSYVNKKSSSVIPFQNYTYISNLNSKCYSTSANFEGRASILSCQATFFVVPVEPKTTSVGNIKVVFKFYQLGM